MAIKDKNIHTDTLVGHLVISKGRELFVIGKYFKLKEKRHYQLELEEEEKEEKARQYYLFSI